MADLTGGTALETPDEEAQEKARVDPEDPATWGEGYCYAPEEVQSALKELVFTYELENTLARLNQVRDVLLHREFWAGRQVTFWSATENRYRVPTAQELDLSEDEYADLLLTINLFRGYCLIVMAELSQSPPRTAFSPEHAKVIQDVKLAKDATKITNYINRLNKVDEKLAYEVWLLCTDASFAEYWRFVRDPKFGIEDYEVQEGENEVELAPDRAVCPTCGAQEPTESPDTAPSMCTDCGAPMGPDSFKPRQTIMQPNMVKKQRPAGREVCDVVGMLEIVIPAYEKDEEELGFLTWCREVHKSKLMSIFPHAADAIQQGGINANITATNERIARLSLLAGWRHVTDGQTNLATFRESWFRPWTYETLREKFGGMKDKFLKWFPEGVKVAFAGDTYCGAWPEALQEHWTICHATPGDGQYRGALGADAIAAQRKFNKCDSIQIETYERGIPFLVHDTDVIATGALEGRTEAAAVYPARGTGAKTVSNSVWQSTPTQVSAQMLQYQEDLRGWYMQHQFGTPPSLWGGSSPGNDTAHGIAIERNAAKGRLGLVYRAIKNFRARCDLKNIKLFLANRTQDVEIAVEGPGSEYDSAQISLADIRGGNVQVEINVDESFPVSLNEQREVVSTLFNNQNPEVMAWFQDLANAQQLVDLLGVSELIRVPGADAREKCFDIIAELIKAAPITPPPPPPQPLIPPPAAGMGPPGLPPPGAPLPMPVPPPPPEPSIQPDPVLDDLGIYIKTCQEWAAGAQGRVAQLENQQGYANVQAFAAKCLALSAPPPMPPPMGPPPNGGPPGGKKPLPMPPEANPTGPLPSGPIGPM